MNDENKMSAGVGLSGLKDKFKNKDVDRAPSRRWLHITGVCGVITSRVAKLFQDMGWFVTGSDLQFFDPAKSFLEENKINTNSEYTFKNLTKDFWEERLATKLDIQDKPDLVVIVESLSTSNKEYKFCKLHNLDVRTYAEVLAEYLIKEDSIVVAGTAGKTTTTSLIAFILKELGVPTNYMIGGTPIGFDETLHWQSDSQISVFEGDEYFSPTLSGHAKFLSYKPKYVVIPHIGYEHQDIYPTEKDYEDAFKKLVELIPADGLVVAKYGNEKIDYVLQNAKAKVIRFAFDSKDLLAKDKYGNEVWTISTHWDPVEDRTQFRIFQKGSEDLKQRGSSDQIGTYTYENMLSAYLLISNLPFISKAQDSDLFFNTIGDIISEFQGVEKRLQILKKTEKVTIIDDFGVTPDRARNSIDTIKSEFPDKKIVAIFEPNAGSRPKLSQDIEKMYKDVFTNADLVYIPDLSSFNSNLATSEELVDALIRLGNKTEYCSVENLEGAIQKQITGPTVIVFFSSYRLTNLAKKIARATK